MKFGSVGSSSDRLDVSVDTLSVDTTVGGAYLQESNGVNVTRLRSAGDLVLIANG